jgi:hypothetical protein
VELKKIDAYLEDENLYRMIRADLPKRYPKTKETRRNPTPVDSDKERAVQILCFSLTARIAECNISSDDSVIFGPTSPTAAASLICIYRRSIGSTKNDATIIGRCRSW